MPVTAARPSPEKSEHKNLRPPSESPRRLRSENTEEALLLLLISESMAHLNKETLK